MRGEELASAEVAARGMVGERCAMTTLPQDERVREPRILKTLHAHNSRHRGVYARVVRPGSVHRGDRAELL